MAQPYDDSTVTQREPVIVIITAALVLVNAGLSALFAFVTLDPGQVAALYGLGNPLAAFVAALVTRGRTAPWEPIELPAHALDVGYDPEVPPTPAGL